MRLSLGLAAAAALFCMAAPAQSEVVSSSPSAFLVRAERHVEAAPDRVWRSLLRIQNWWNDEHTYSGDAENMRLDPHAGGCWCESWGRGQSVEHARIVLAMERDGVRTLRAVGGLGPLQELGAIGIMTFTIAPHAGGASVTMTYRVSGEPSLNLDRIAPLVDRVLLEQVDGLVRYSSGGTPG